MDAAAAETASALLLDDDEKNFAFYEVKGSTKPMLTGATFPAEKGIAGEVLRT
jgi:hypothetical protein